MGLYPHGPVELDDGRLLYLGSGTFDGTHGRRQSRSSLDSISGIIRNRKPKPAKLSVESSAVRAPWSSYRHSSGISLLTPISFVSSRGGASLALVLVWASTKRSRR